MAKTRISFSNGVNRSLFNQVDGVCPRCLTPLQYEKNGSLRKSYEIAHIYPLNPTKEESRILNGVERLSEDVNHEDNLIALCSGCHTKFDKPRTVEDYNNLLRTKKDCINRAMERKLWSVFPIEDDISSVIDALCSATSFDSDIKIDMNVNTVDEKISKDEPLIFKNKIKQHISDYYVYIKGQFALADKAKPGAAELIAGQIKIYYLKQKQKGSKQQEIYGNIAEWIFVKSGKINLNAAEIMTSFFVQNCEVFDASS